MAARNLNASKELLHPQLTKDDSASTRHMTSSLNVPRCRLFVGGLEKAPGWDNQYQAPSVNRAPHGLQNKSEKVRSAVHGHSQPPHFPTSYNTAETSQSGLQRKQAPLPRFIRCPGARTPFDPAFLPYPRVLPPSTKTRPQPLLNARP